MQTKIFYRVANIETHDGLWYDQQGIFTGKIHKEFDFLGASQLLMPEDKELVGFISVADSLEHLGQWFTKSERERLRESNYHTYAFLAEDYKYYSPFSHNVINQQTSRVLHKIQ